MHARGSVVKIGCAGKGVSLVDPRSYVPPSFLTSLPSGIWSGVDGLSVLPYLPGQAVTVTKAPMWSTEVVRTASGRERRTAYWPYPLWQFELGYAGESGHYGRPTTSWQA